MRGLPPLQWSLARVLSRVALARDTTLTPPAVRPARRARTAWGAATMLAAFIDAACMMLQAGGGVSVGQTSLDVMKP